MARLHVIKPLHLLGDPFPRTN